MQFAAFVWVNIVTGSNADLAGRGCVHLKASECTYVVECDLLVVPAKRRRSPRPATPKVPLLGVTPTPHFPAFTQVRYCRYSRAGPGDRVCVYYCSTYYKAFREGGGG